MLLEIKKIGCCKMGSSYCALALLTGDKTLLRVLKIENCWCADGKQLQAIPRWNTHLLEDVPELLINSLVLQPRSLTGICIKTSEHFKN